MRHGEHEVLSRKAQARSCVDGRSRKRRHAVKSWWLPLRASQRASTWRRTRRPKFFVLSDSLIRMLKLLNYFWRPRINLYY